MVLIVVFSWNKFFEGNKCPADINGDKRIDSLDLALFKEHYSEGTKSDIDLDLNHDDKVNTLDLNYILSSYNQPCK